MNLVYKTIVKLMNQCASVEFWLLDSVLLTMTQYNCNSETASCSSFRAQSKLPRLFSICPSFQFGWLCHDSKFKQLKELIFHEYFSRKSQRKNCFNNLFNRLRVKGAGDVELHWHLLANVWHFTSSEWFISLAEINKQNVTKCCLF